VPTTVSRSRGRQGVHSGAQGAAGDHMRKIMATSIAATVVIIFVLVGTKAGHTIDAATQHFMLYYAGVLALVGLTGSVLLGLVATDRIVMTPGHRVMAQAVHRAFAFGTLAFLTIHITTEVLAQRSHAIDAVIPFLSPYRTFYIGLGTIASDLIVLLVVTSILRKRFTGHGRAWQWRAIHYSSYVAFVFGVLHGLLGGREAKPYVDWSYGFAIAVTALGLAVRFLAISLRPKESVGPAPSVDRARPSGSSPLHAAAMSMAQTQLGGTVQMLPAGMGARGAPIGVPGPDRWAAAALPAPGWSPSSGPIPALDPAPAYAGPSSPSDAYRDLGFQPLGAPPHRDDVPNGMRGRPYLGVDQSRPSRQPLYEPGYDGPPRFEGAPRGHGDVPADELSSHPYGPQGHRQQSAAPYVDDYPDRAGSEGRTGVRPGWPESGRPRAAISPPPRPEDRSPGPMPTLGTGPIPQLGTRPMPRPEGAATPWPEGAAVPRPEGAATPRPDTGPMPRAGTGPMPRAGTGPMPRAGTGPMPRAGTGPMPRANSGPMPRLGTGPMPRPEGAAMPRPDTGPMPRVGNGQVPRNGTGPVPRAGTGPMPRAGTGSMPNAGTGPMPRAGTGPMPNAGTGPMPRAGTGPMPHAGTGPMPHAGTGPMPRANSGPMPRLGTGPTPRPDTGAMARPETGPLPRLGPGPMSRPDTGSLPQPGAGPGPWPGQPVPPADPADGPRTSAQPRAAGRLSRRAKPNDPRYRDIPGPTGGDEWE
jgi:DMSO/TMAO reductase YedYZ heme-binding membrane subunit